MKDNLWKLPKAKRKSLEAEILQAKENIAKYTHDEQVAANLLTSATYNRKQAEAKLSGLIYLTFTA